MNYYQNTIDQMKAKHEESMLNIFILIEENTFESKKAAIQAYMLLKGIKSPANAWVNLKEAYSKFNSK